MTYAPTAIDTSRLPPPDAIENVSFETFLSDIKSRFLEQWAVERLRDASLPEFTESDIETHPFIVVLRTWIYARGLDRQRVNDGIRALLAPLAQGNNLDAVAAARNIARLVVSPATPTAAAVMEGDEALLRRYLLSYDLAAAGSPDRYLYEAWVAWPQSADKALGLWDARVNGFDVHGRRGDTDIVIIGPAGRLPTEPERKQVRDAVTATNVKPDATSVAVLAATRAEYAISLIIEVPGAGPAPETIRQEVENRVRAAAAARTLIGGEIPEGLMVGAAYGDNVIKVRDLAPALIAADPYSVPVMTALSVSVEVRA